MFLLVASIPVPDTVDVKVTHVVTLDLAYGMTVLLDLSYELVLGRPP